MMSLGLVYFVFLPSIVTTPAAGIVVRRFDTTATLWLSLAVAGIGLPLLLLPDLVAVLAGLVAVRVGALCAPATATASGRPPVLGPIAGRAGCSALVAGAGASRVHGALFRPRQFRQPDDQRDVPSR